MRKVGVVSVTKKIDLERANAIEEYLRTACYGRENIVSSKFLEQKFMLRGSTLRRCINYLRKCGVPIASDGNGYYYAAKPIDLEITLHHMKGRFQSISEATLGLEMAYRKMLKDQGFPTQETLDDPSEDGSHQQ